MGPVPEQVLPGTSTGPLNKVNTLNPQPFALGVAGRFGGGTPRPPGQEDPGPSPQRVQGPGGLRPGQAGRAQKMGVLRPPPGPPWPPLAPPRPPLPPPGPLAPWPPGPLAWPPLGLGPVWPPEAPNPLNLLAPPAPLGPPGPPEPPWNPGFGASLTGPLWAPLPGPWAAQTDPGLGPWSFVTE